MAGMTPTDYDSLQPLLDRLQSIEDQLRTLQSPQGTQLAGLVAQVQQAIVGIGAAVSSFLAGGFSTGSMSASGSITAGGNITASGQVQGNTGVFNGGLTSLNARSFVVATNYAASWIDVNGRFGISPSTLRFKTDIVEWDDAEGIFGVRPVWYHLSIPPRDIAVLDNDGMPVLDEDGLPVFQHYDGFEDAPDAPLRSGFIAEELIDAGFPDAVVFDEDGLPVSINYAMWVVPQQMALRWMHERRAEDVARIADLERRLDAAGI